MGLRQTLAGGKHRDGHKDRIGKTIRHEDRFQADGLAPGLDGEGSFHDAARGECHRLPLDLDGLHALPGSLRIGIEVELALLRSRSIARHRDSRIVQVAFIEELRLDQGNFHRHRHDHFHE